MTRNQTVTYGLIRRLLNENFDELVRLKRAVGKPDETRTWPLDDALAILATGLVQAHDVLVDARKIAESLAAQCRGSNEVTR